MSLISIFIVHLLALASPGPDFVFISQTAANESRKNTLFAVIGVVTAIGIWSILAMSGLSFIIEHSPVIYNLMLLAGGSYLMWLGIGAVLSCFKNTQSTQEATAVTQGNGHFFIKGLFTNLANPKALAYFGSVFAVVVGHSGLHKLIIMFIMVLIESLVWFYLVATLFSLNAIAKWYRNKLKIINFICGVAFICFGLGLVYSLVVKIFLERV